jgi:hypothetical protein
VVRLGHPARLLPTVVAHSLDALVAASDDTAIIAEVKWRAIKLGKTKFFKNFRHS